MEQNRPKLDLPLTRTGKLLELGGYLIFIALWAITFYVYLSSPETIPIHYNLRGEADGFGHRGHVFITAGIATFVFGIITAILPMPHAFNYLVTITEENAEIQYRKAQQILRVVRILIMGMMAGFLIQETFSTNHKLGVGFIVMEALFVVVIPIFIVVYSTQGTKKKPVG